MAKVRQSADWQQCSIFKITITHPQVTNNNIQHIIMYDLDISSAVTNPIVSYKG